MRARQRHLNPRDIGATLVLDTRRITGLSNNDPVSTWTDISSTANNATSSLTARPLYKTGQSGGNPSLNFDGSNDFMTLTSAITGTGTRTVLGVTKKVSGANMVCLAPSSGSGGSYSCFDFTDSNLYITDSAYFRSSSGGNLTTYSVIIDRINGGLQNGTSDLFVNGVQKSLSAASINAGVDEFKWVGRRNTNYANGDMCLIVEFTLSVSNSVFKRIQFAAAFSFKIACS